MMRNYPNSGYVVKAEEIVPLLKPEDREEFLKLLSDPEKSYWDFDEWIEKHGTIDGTVSFPSFYTFREEDESENFSPGDTIAIFRESDLFELTPTPALKRMEKLGVDPKKSVWTTWG